MAKYKEIKTGPGSDDPMMIGFFLAQRGIMVSIHKALDFTQEEYEELKPHMDAIAKMIDKVSDRLFNEYMKKEDPVERLKEMLDSDSVKKALEKWGIDVNALDLDMASIETEEVDGVNIVKVEGHIEEDPKQSTIDFAEFLRRAAEKKRK